MGHSWQEIAERAEKLAQKCKRNDEGEEEEGYFGLVDAVIEARKQNEKSEKCKCTKPCKCKNPNIKLQIVQKKWTDADLLAFGKKAHFAGVMNHGGNDLIDLLKIFKKEKNDK